MSNFQCSTIITSNDRSGFAPAGRARAKADAPEETNEELGWRSGLDSVDRAVDEVSEYVRGEVEELFAGTDGAENVVALRPGQVAVGELKATLAGSAGVGADLSGRLSYSVSRDSEDRYEAVFEANGGAALEVGESIEDEGIAADVGSTGGARVVIRGEGEGARDAIARMLDAGGASAAIDIARESPHLEVARVEGAVGGKASAGASLFVGGSASFQGNQWVGVSEGGIPVVRTEQRVAFAIDTPAYQSADRNAARTMMRGAIAGQVGIPPELVPDELAERVLDATGGEVGVTLAAKLETYTEVGGENGPMQLGMTLSVEAGARTLRLDLTTRLEADSVDARETLGGRGVASLFAQLEGRARVDVGLSEVTFDGFSLRGLPIEAKSGIETTVPVWAMRCEVR